jgi:Ca-activated chloride channel homolog
MRFLWPEMLWLLALVPAMAALYVAILLSRRRRALNFPSLRLVHAALTPGARWRRHVPPALLLASMAAALVALARPVASIVLPAEFMTLVLSMDVSRSMLAADVQPNRIIAAQAAARSFIESLPGNVRVGITSFAGTAQVVQTPTDSKDELLAALERFQLQRATATGSGILISLALLRPDAGIDLEAITFGRDFGTPDPEARARRELKPERKKLPAVAPGSYAGGAIVLLSDGRRTSGPDPIEAAKLAAKLGVRIYTVGFGTKDGAEIPGFEGYSFYARLDEETLRAVASITAAEYFHAGSAADLKKVYDGLSARFAMERRDTEVSAFAAGLAALLLLAAGGLSLAWHRHRAA